MLDELLKNRKAKSVKRLDGVGVPTTDAVGSKDVTGVLPIEEGVLVMFSSTTMFVPWEKVVSVLFDEVLGV